MQSMQISGRCDRVTPILLDSHTPPLVIYASGSVVHIVSLKSGALIDSFTSHTQAITKLLLHPTDPDIIISSSLDGSIRYWHVDTLQETRNVQTNTPIYDLLLPRTTNSPLIYLVTSGTRHDSSFIPSEDHKQVPSSDKADKYWLGAYDTQEQVITKTMMSLRHATHCLASMQLQEEYLVGINKSSVNFWSLQGDARVKFKSDIGAMNCLAVNTAKDIIVTGHRKGEIMVWHDMSAWLASVKIDPAARLTIIQGKLKPLSTLLHWHAHPLSSLTFNQDGNFLYSGGEEGVLVQWQLSSNNNKVFLPRLGAPLATVQHAGTQALIVVTTKDNCLHVVDTARMKIEWTVQSLCTVATSPDAAEDIIYQADPNFRCKVSLDPSQGLLACNGYPGHLQFFDANTHSYHSSLEVVQYTRVSRTEKYTRIYVPSVSFFAFSTVVHQSAVYFYLATIDVRRGEEIGIEDSLKIWLFNRGTGKYAHIAQIDRPHGNHRVVSLTLQQGSLGCITTANDGSVKLWTTTASSSLNAEAESQWTCLYTFKYRDCPANFVSFSADNSLQSIAYENVVSLWDPRRLALQTTIVSPTSNNILFTAFIEPCFASALGGGNGQAYLVLGSRRSLSLVNLMTLKPVWTALGRFASFAVAKDESQALNIQGQQAWIACSMAPPHATLATTDGETDTETQPAEYSLVFFGLATDKPLFKLSLPIKANSLCFTAVGLLYLLASGELFIYGERKEVSSSTGSNKGKFALTPLAPLNASLLDNTSSHAPVVPLQSSVEAIPTSSSSWMTGYIDKDTANMPPIESIYGDFMKNFLPAASAVTAEAQTLAPAAPATSVPDDAPQAAASEDGGHLTTEKLHALKQSTMSLFMKMSGSAVGKHQSSSETVVLPLKKRKTSILSEEVAVPSVATSDAVVNSRRSGRLNK